MTRATVTPKTKMADFMTVTTVSSEAEAEMICALREAGIECFHRKANLAASIEAAPYAGPRDVLVLLATTLERVDTQPGWTR